MTALAAALLGGSLTAAPSAAADSSGCTHHLSGAQVCIRLEGRNGAHSVTGFWANPPKRVKTRVLSYYVDGKRQESARGHRVGKTIIHTWRTSIRTGHKVCVKLQGTSRTACQEPKYVGDRRSS